MYFRRMIICLLLLNLGCSQQTTISKGDPTNYIQSPLQVREAQLARNYLIQEVSFLSDSGSIQLAGELTRPFGDGPFPGIVMITGSGPQDRDESIAGHRPFLILSDYLVKKGIAVLRYDDRGVGKSTGEFESAIIPDFALDAANAMKWLKKQNFIDKSKVGYLGHSEGGIVGPLATQITDAEFLILLASPVLPLNEILSLREKLRAKLEPAKEAETVSNLRRFKVLFETIQASESSEQAFHAAKKNLISLGEPEQVANDWAKIFTSPLLYWVAKYDPSLILKEFQGPILAVYASEDTKITPVENAAKIKDITENEGSRVVIAEGLNHLFQPVQPGSISNYEDSEISFDDSVLKIIGNWAEQQLK